MISHEISWWDISVVKVSRYQWYLTVVEMIEAIQVLIQLIQDNQVTLAHLWVDFRVFFKRIDFLAKRSTFAFSMSYLESYDTQL